MHYSNAFSSHHAFLFYVFYRAPSHLPGHDDIFYANLLSVRDPVDGHLARVGATPPLHFELIYWFDIVRYFKKTYTPIAWYTSCSYVNMSVPNVVLQLLVSIAKFSNQVAGAGTEECNNWRSIQKYDQN